MNLKKTSTTKTLEELWKIWPLWLLESTLFRLSKLNQPKFMAALDNFWHFIQMNSSDPGWSNTNGDVTDLRSMHLLPVCGLWIICGPVGPRSSDLFVKEFDKKGSCITVNAPISSKNPFTAKEEGTCFFNMCLLKSTQREGTLADWGCVHLEKIFIWNEYLNISKYIEANARCRWLVVSEVRFLFWYLQMDFMVAYELWLSQTTRGCIEQSFLSKHTDGYLNYRVKKSFYEECKNTPANSVTEPRLERAYLWINPQILGEWPFVSHKQGILHDQVLWNFDCIAPFENLLIADWKHGDVFPPGINT